MPVSTRQRPAERGRLKGIAAGQRFTTEIREARLNHAISQTDAAREAGIARTTWTRIERGDQTSLTFEQAGRMAGVVGLDFVVQLYPSSTILHDAGQVRLLREVRVMPGPDWSWRYEVTLGPAPEQRAWDMVGTHRVTGLVIRIEGETRLRDCQATVRRLASKRFGDPHRLVVAVRASRHNPAAVRAAADVVGAEFEIATARTLRALRSGEDPGRDTLLFVDWIAAASSAA
jgi:DNA-binding XRE family transcriptional regulator